MDFQKLYAGSTLPVGNRLKIQAGEINSNEDQSIRETGGGRIIITAKVTDQDTVALQPYYANKSNASTVRPTANAPWKDSASI